MTEKSREQKLRRMAARQGLIACKGKRPLNFGSGWMIVDQTNNMAVSGIYPYEFSLSLEEAEAYIRSE